MEPKDNIDIEAIVKQLATEQSKRTVIRRLTEDEKIKCVCGHYKKYHIFPCDLEGTMKCKFTLRHCRCKGFKTK